MYISHLFFIVFCLIFLIEYTLFFFPLYDICSSIYPTIPHSFLQGFVMQVSYRTTMQGDGINQARNSTVCHLCVCVCVLACRGGHSGPLILHSHNTSVIQPISLSIFLCSISDYETH